MARVPTGPSVQALRAYSDGDDYHYLRRAPILVRILKEQPEWAAAIRSLLLSEELLALPARFAEFVQVT